MLMENGNHRYMKGFIDYNKSGVGVLEGTHREVNKPPSQIITLVA